jgi:hypothetical protein
LAVAVSAGPVTGVIAGFWLPTGSAVLIGVVAVVAGLVAPLAERARVEIAGRGAGGRQLSAQVVIRSARGGVPRVADCRDPIALGVHPAEPLAGGGRVPPFVARDVDGELRAALARPGFVLIVGESAAGKSRAGVEAMRAVLADYPIVVPADGPALATLVEQVAQFRRCVIWLDDLERFLGLDGLSVQVLTGLLDGGAGRQVVVLATMRTQERARYDRVHEAGLDDAGRQVWRRGREVIERADEIRVERRWSEHELGRAASHSDGRIVRAVAQAGRFGVAEVLAAGPELINTLRHGWTPGQHPRGAALVTAAVACRRTGVHRPLPLALLDEVHEPYLAARGGADLRPEILSQALAFATTTVYATTSLLLPDDRGGYLAHDYLLDALPIDPIAESTWPALLTWASPSEAYEIGRCAYDAFVFDHARTAFTRAAEAGVPNAAYMLAVTVGTAGRPAQAVTMLTQLHTTQQATLGPNHPDTLATRYNLALFSGHAGREAAAARAFAELVTDRQRRHGADHPDTLACRRLHIVYAHRHSPTAAVAGLRQLHSDNLRALGSNHPDTLRCRCMIGVWTSNAGHRTAGITELRQVVADQTALLGPDHLDTLRSRGYLARHLGLSDPHTAVVELDHLVQNATRILGPNHPYTLECRHDLAVVTGQTGDLTTAITSLEHLLSDNLRILGPDHPDTLETRHNLADAIGHAGNPTKARDALHQLLSDRQRILDPNDPYTQQTRTRLAEWTRATQ